MISRKRFQTPLISYNDIIILIFSYEEAIDMIVSFTINACFVEMFDYSTTLRKRTKTRKHAATRETRLLQRRFTRLNENVIEIRETMRFYLNESYTVIRMALEGYVIAYGGCGIN